MSARALVIAVLAIWIATLVSALAALVGARANAGSAPYDALPASLGTAFALLTHNAPVALWPLALVAIGWPALRGARQVGDVVVVAQLLGHGVTVGSQLGRHPDTWRYLPHLPLEWFAIAVPAAVWLHARALPAAHTDVVARLVLPAGMCLAALTAAAAIETYLVPVR